MGTEMCIEAGVNIVCAAWVCTKHVHQCKRPCCIGTRQRQVTHPSAHIRRTGHVLCTLIQISFPPLPLTALCPFCAFGEARFAIRN